MDRSNIIYLVKEEYTQGDIGQQAVTETKRKVFCDVSSVSGSEWMDAGRNGIKAEYKISMFRYDYQGELIVELNGDRYSVYRTYAARNETVELYLEKKAGV